MAKERFQPKLHVKQGDTVKVISGDYKGTVGKVEQVFPNENRAIVEGVNTAKKHMKPTANNPGGIVEKLLPIHVSNLMLFDSKTNKTFKVGRRKLENGKSVRYSKSSNEVID
jgi:large subunit ribosomal protein L24